MKKMLLFIAVLFGANHLLLSQTNVVWSEEFNGGSTGWTVRTSQCGVIAGPAIGQWNLTSATLNGTPIPNLQGEFSVNTAEEYSVRFSDGTNRAEAQARYTVAGNVWTSNLNGVTIPLDTTIVNYNTTNRQTLYFSRLSITPDAFTQWGATFLGLNSPTVTVSGTTLTIASSDNTVQLVFNQTSTCGAMWWWSPNGSVRSGALFNATTGEVTINSPTGANGAMVINADYLTTQGLSANVPAAQPYPQYTSELISPIIDLSNVTSSVSLRFYELVRFLNVSSNAPAAGLRTSYSFSTDGGTTWSAAVNANPDLAVNSGIRAERLFPLPGAQGSANVRVKFTWSSDFYYWALDDVAIVETPRYDMRVNTTFFAITPNFATPISQVDPYHFLADIENVGGGTSTNVNLNLTIIKNQTVDTVYNGNVFYGNVDAGVLAENYIFPTSLDPANLSVGTFNGTYRVTLDSTDFFPANNTINWNFVVTDSLFAKEGSRTRGVAPAAQPSFTYGNVYYMPHGAGLYARYLSFTVDNAAAVAGRTITTLLYRWENTNNNASAEPAEYGQAPIAFNSYTFTGTEGTNFITIPVDLDENAIELEDNVHYIVAVQYFTEDAQSLFLGANGVLNYGAMRFLTDSLQNSRYHTALLVGQESNPTFGLVAFGTAITPQIRLSIGDNPDINGPAFITSNVNQVTKENLIEVFPNPASEIVNVKLLLNEVQNIQVTIFDQSGHMIGQRKFDNVSRETITLPVQNLPAGTYYIRVATPNGVNVRPVIINR